MLSLLNAGNQPTMTSYTGTRRQQHYLFFASGDATYTIELFLGKIGSFESPQMTNHATFAESGIILRFLETLRERLGGCFGAFSDLSTIHDTKKIRPILSTLWL